MNDIPKVPIARLAALISRLQDKVAPVVAEINEEFRDVEPTQRAGAIASYLTSELVHLSHSMQCPERILRDNFDGMVKRFYGG